MCGDSPKLGLIIAYHKFVQSLKWICLKLNWGIWQKIYHLEFASLYIYIYIYSAPHIWKIIIINQMYLTCQ